MTGRWMAVSGTVRGIGAAAVVAGSMLAGTPAEARFEYAAPEAPAGAAGAEVAACGYSSAAALEERASASRRGADGMYSFGLRCGEMLAEALGRWGAAHGVLVVRPPGGEGWRVGMDYRFRAESFADALARLRAGFAWPAPGPVFAFRPRDGVLVLLREDGE